MKRGVQFFLILKGLLLLSLLATYGVSHFGHKIGDLFAAKKEETENHGILLPENDKEKKLKSADSKVAQADAETGLPTIPENSIPLNQSILIREKLQLLRSDVENKIKTLKNKEDVYQKLYEKVQNTLQRVKEERSLLNETLIKEKKIKEERIKRTETFLVKMEPRKAAPMFEAMDKDLVVHLLKRLPSKKVTKILEAMNPQKASEYMEFYTKIRSGREYEVLKEMGLCEPTQ